MDAKRQKQIWRRLNQIVRKANDFLKEWGIDDAIFLARKGERTPFQFKGEVYDTTLILKKLDTEIGTYWSDYMELDIDNRWLYAKIFGKWCREYHSNTVIRCSPELLVAACAFAYHYFLNNYVRGVYCSLYAGGAAITLKTHEGISFTLEFYNDEASLWWRREDNETLLLRGQPDAVVKEAVKLIGISSL